MDRRSLLKQDGLVSTWLGITVIMQGCSSDDDNPVAVGSGDVSATIGANHGHAVVITSAQLDANNAVTLSLSGGGHGHAVSLTAAQVSDIGAGMRVQATSTSGAGHTHGVTFN